MTLHRPSTVPAMVAHLHQVWHDHPGGIHCTVRELGGRTIVDAIDADGRCIDARIITPELED